MNDEREPWRHVPVFIASTFRGMDSERDAIALAAIPAVNERLRGRGLGIAVYPVDLRWGIETDERIDASIRQRIILDTCVSEVRRCRPLFIGLLGGRHSALSDMGLAKGALDAAGLRDPGVPLSVTLIEMLAAVEAQDGVAPILLVRRAPLADREAAVAAGIHEDLPGSAGHDALVRTEDHFASLGHPFIPYEARWVAEERLYRSETLVKQVVDALMATVEGAFVRARPRDWLDDELEAQRWAAEREARQFVGRAEDIKLISAFWDPFRRIESLNVSGDDPHNPLWKLRRRLNQTVLGVVGTPGSGKSALLAKAATDIEFTDTEGFGTPLVRAYVRVGTTAASERLPVCLLLLLAQLDPDAARGVAIPKNPEGLRLDAVLPAWLTALHHGSWVLEPLIVVDGLDRIQGSPTDILPLSWLPISLDGKVRVLVSAVEETVEAALLRTRPSTLVHTLGALSPADATALVRGRVAAHHRTLPPGIVEQLVGTSTLPRWLVVATDLLLTLMAYDYLALPTPSAAAGDAQAALRQLLRSTAHDLPADLDAIHEEVLDRLMSLLADRSGAVLGVLGTAVFGLDDHDLRAVLRSLGLPFTDADLALLRDVLSAHVHVRRNEWRFVHQSAADAVRRTFERFFQDTGLDSALGYGRALVRYFSTRPVDDPGRTRELLAMLLLTGEHQALVRCLSAPELATDEAVGMFGVPLGAALRDGRSASVCIALIEAGADDRERLTVVEFVLGFLQVLPAPEREEVIAACRTVIAEASPEVRGRFGLSVAALVRLLDQGGGEALATAEARAIAEWITRAEENGRVTVRDAPLRWRPPLDRDALVELTPEMQLLAEYSIAVSTGIFTPAAGDEDWIRARLQYWWILCDSLGDAGTVSQLAREALLNTAERAARIAWPDAPFRPDDDDFAQCRALVDRARGNAEFVCLLGRSARVHAIEILQRLDDADDPTDADTVLIHEALGLLDEAMWQLNAQLALTPNVFAVEVIAIQCAGLHSSLLASCRQHGSASRSGVSAFTHPLVAEIVGWAGFVLLAGRTMVSYLQARSSVDPSPMIIRVADELDRRRAAGRPLGEAAEAGGLDGLLLLCSLMAIWPTGNGDLASQMLTRTFSLLDAGDPDVTEELLPMVNLARELLAELEDEIRDDVDDDDDDVETLASIVPALYDMRVALMSRLPGEPSDTVGAMFSASYAGWVLGQPERCADARRLRVAVDSAALDERCLALCAAADKLLSRESCAPS